MDCCAVKARCAVAVGPAADAGKRPQSAPDILRIIYLRIDRKSKIRVPLPVKTGLSRRREPLHPLYSIGRQGKIPRNEKDGVPGTSWLEAQGFPIIAPADSTEWVGWRLHALRFHGSVGTARAMIPSQGRDELNTVGS
jgi:hypothetical protein